MKKIFAISVLAALAIAGCKKKQGSVSELHNYSTPTITLADGYYYSIPVNGLLPVIPATAYDSFYHADAVVVFDQSMLDVTKPGVYPVIATARNQYGMGNSDTLYVAVTDIDPTIDLAGTYLRVSTDDTVKVTRLANGLYRTSDVAGNGPADVTHVVPAMFVQTSTTSLVMPVQESKFGTFYATNGVVSMTPDVTYQYILHNNAFAPVTRTFRKL
ncbi:hypothetical protein GCM10023093_13240 [Nemorincola caseinilytica]|uniref:DUF4397 domain-containing protein n=1 Tax=Nemorincola caseinilytica TaxID=2054315 RepID=A0ABP8NAE4_9BACT